MLDGRNRLRKTLSISIPAILLAILAIFLLNKSYTGGSDIQPIGTLAGKPLAAYAELYPVEADSNGMLVLNPHKFIAAVDYLTNSPSPKAIADLIYIGQANNVALALNEKEKEKYSKLLNIKAYRSLLSNDSQQSEVLQTYKQIVNGVGETFEGMPIEIVLHDTRDPIHSIVAVQNPISGRKLGGANSNFGVELIKNYSTVNAEAANFVSYPLKLKDGRDVKSTTIPIFDKRFGLVALLCINIDISKLEKNDPKAVQSLVTALIQVHPQERITEIIENAHHPK